MARVNALKGGPNRTARVAQTTALVLQRMARYATAKVNVFAASVFAIQTQAILDYNVKIVR